MKNRLSFSQLWVEEEEFLAASAARLPQGAVVVDLGTAQGGSSYLFATNAKLGTAIHSFDIAPSAEAYHNLDGTDVTIHAMASQKGADAWPEFDGRKIDLLLIDASHTLLDAAGDFIAWRPHLSPDAVVMFHDYDPVKKGGYPHLGVRVAVDGLIATGAYRLDAHVGRLAVGTTLLAGPTSIDGRAFAAALARLDSQFERLLRPPTVVCLLQQDVGVVASLLDLASLPYLTEASVAADGMNLGQIRHYNRPYAGKPAFASSLADADCEPLTDYQLLRLVGRLLRDKRDGLLALAADRKRFFKYEELLFMLEHGLGRDPMQTPGEAGWEPTLEELSGFVAARIVCLSFLFEIKLSLSAQQF